MPLGVPTGTHREAHGSPKEVPTPTESQREAHGRPKGSARGAALSLYGAAVWVGKFIVSFMLVWRR